MIADSNASTDSCLISLLELLKRRAYDFVPPTPRTHAVVRDRDLGRRATSDADILGWNLPFDAASIDPELADAMDRSGVVEGPPECRRATVRVARLNGDLFLHSAFPTIAQDAVFFGPDSYRFADLICAEVATPEQSPGTVVDIGTGAGVGAVVAGKFFPAAQVFATDVNAAALRLARVNAATAGVPIDLRQGDILADVPGFIDLALANPPYIVDAGRRTYRDGGKMHGAELSLRMARAVLPRLNPGGAFILYTGSAIVDGRDALRHALEKLAADQSCSLRYRMIDPDVFGEELRNSSYADVDRIAVVGAIFRREPSA